MAVETGEIKYIPPTIKDHVRPDVLDIALSEAKTENAIEVTIVQKGNPFWTYRVVTRYVGSGGRRLKRDTSFSS